MPNTTRRVFRVVCVLLSVTWPAVAQTPELGTSLSIGGSFMNLNTVDALGEQHLTGFGLGGKATVAFGRFGLGLRYLEGSLSQDGNGAERDIVEGEAIVSLRAAPWLRFGLGPHIRSLVVPEGTERWLFWEGRIQTKTRLGTPGLVSEFELWQVFSNSVDVDEQYDGGQGFEGLLRWDVSSFPLWVGLGYRIHRSNLGDSRTEVMEHLLISFGLGRGVQR